MLNLHVNYWSKLKRAMVPGLNPKELQLEFFTSWKIDHWELLFGASHLGMNVSSRSIIPQITKDFSLYIKPSVKVYHRVLISLEKSLWHLMTHLHQTLYTSCALSIIIDVRKIILLKAWLNLISTSYLKRQLNITFSKLLAQVRRNDTGQ